MSSFALAKHLFVDKFDDLIRRAHSWVLWVMIAGMVVLDYVFIDVFPLVDEVVMGGITVKIVSELWRRRNAAKELEDKKPPSPS